MPFLKVNDAQIYYESHGSGSPLVLIAGYACDHTFWTGMLHDLAERFQVIIFDNRAVGQTKDGGADITLDMLVDDTMGLIKQLGIERPHVTGHSMGGGIAQLIATKYPNDIAKLIIMNSAAKINVRAMAALEDMLNLRKQNVDLDVLIETCMPWFFSSSYLSKPDNIAKFKKILMSNPYFQTVEDQARQFKALQLFDTENCLREIKSPTLIIGAEEDIVSLPQDSEHLAKSIAGAKLVTIPGAHSVPLELPAKVNQAVISFLSSKE